MYEDDSLVKYNFFSLSSLQTVNHYHNGILTLVTTSPSALSSRVHEVHHY